MCAVVKFDAVPLINSSIKEYIAQGCVPGGTNRNRGSYGHKIADLSEEQWAILADPQTSGGLLIAINKNAADDLIKILNENGLSAFTNPIGQMTPQQEKIVSIQ